MDIGGGVRKPGGRGGWGLGLEVSCAHQSSVPIGPGQAAKLGMSSTPEVFLENTHMFQYLGAGKALLISA